MRAGIDIWPGRRLALLIPALISVERYGRKDVPTPPPF